MKYHTQLRLLLIFVVGLGGSIEGMEKPAIAPQKEYVLRMQNLTPDKFEFGYYYDSDEDTKQTEITRKKIYKVRTRTLIPTQAIDIPNYTKLAGLEVHPYGWVKSKIGKSEGANLVFKYMLRKKKQDLTIMVESTQVPYMTSLFERLLAYSYKYKIEPSIQNTEDYTTLADAFPQVKYALHWHLPLEPRYFLSVSSNADTFSIDKAYKQLREEWLKKVISDDLKMKIYASEVLTLVRNAHEVLLLQLQPNVKQAEILEKKRKFTDQVNRIFGQPRRYDITDFKGNVIATLPMEMLVAILEDNQRLI